MHYGRLRGGEKGKTPDPFWPAAAKKHRKRERPAPVLSSSRPGEEGGEGEESCPPPPPGLGDQRERKKGKVECLLYFMVFKKRKKSAEMLGIPPNGVRKGRGGVLSVTRRGAVPGRCRKQARKEVSHSHREIGKKKIPARRAPRKKPVRRGGK